MASVGSKVPRILQTVSAGEINVLRAAQHVCNENASVRANDATMVLALAAHKGVDAVKEDVDKCQHLIVPDSEADKDDDVEDTQKHVVPVRVLERRISDRLATVLGGRREASCTYGRVDVLTDTDVIEVKHVSRYKGGIGQALVYRTCFPGTRARLHVYGEEEKMPLFVKARKACKSLDVDFSFEFV